MKSGPFAEHSRYLYDISAVPEWSKVGFPFELPALTRALRSILGW
jgi:hypothetical protein